jgi:hypothetical protein
MGRSWLKIPRFYDRATVENTGFPMTSEKILLWIAFSGNCQYRFADPLGNDDPTDETNT